MRNRTYIAHRPSSGTLLIRIRARLRVLTATPRYLNTNTLSSSPLLNNNMKTETYNIRGAGLHLYRVIPHILRATTTIMMVMVLAMPGAHEPVERTREAIDAHWALTREETAWPVGDELGLAFESAVGAVHVWQICSMSVTWVGAR